MKTPVILTFLVLVLTLFEVCNCNRFQLKEDYMDPDIYCKNRKDNDLFRKKIPEGANQKTIKTMCQTFYRCIPAANGLMKLSSTKCLNSLKFDVELQICQISRKVTNCELESKFQPPLPKWPLKHGEVTHCTNGTIECGSGDCVAKEFFCDDFDDCEDGSDENACGPETDPNAASTCDLRTCNQKTDCFCSVDGTRIPGNLSPDKTPQMILITFSGAVNQRNFQIFDDIFSGNIKNKGNDCTPKATFFVSHAYTNYSAVQELHRRGHEIAAHSITNDEKKDWSRLSNEEYYQEFEGNRAILERFANISQGEIIGLRVPQGRVGGNKQFSMMDSNYFKYDSSLAAVRGRLPLWPYTLTHRMPHKCIGTDQNCPSKNFTVWEMVMNELDRREDPKFEEQLTGCFLVDQCSNINGPKIFREFLDHNLAFHYNTNRAPFGLHFTAAYFENHKGLTEVLKEWIRDISLSGNYYFVTNSQAIQWMEHPTELSSVSSFIEWKTNCVVEGLPHCSIPNPCASKVPRLFPKEQQMFLYTCEECPITYPWLLDPYGDGINDIQ